MSDSIIGTEVEGYRIQEVLGRGGMGVVYKAEDVALSRDVALKRIDPSLANDEAFLRRFRSEARALARIDSPYIVSVHALRQTEIGLLLVMEYVEGGTLKDLIREGPMDWQQALPIIEQMLTALEHAHGAEVIHRDIKPRNVMLSAKGTVKVTDFGLAKVYRPDSDETVTQGVHGTLNYMSPEQVQGGANLDHRSDLYSLGMTVYEMLAGELPFDEDSSEFTKMRRIVEEPLPRPDQLRPQVPDGLSALVMKALEKDPEDRFQSADVMREAFVAFEEKHGGEAPPSPPPTDLRAADSPSSGSGWKRVGGLAVLALLVAGAALWWMDGEPPPPKTRLSVSTEPLGATVFLEGTRIGATPLPDTSIEGRSARVRVQRAGYVPIDTVARLEGTEEVELRLPLTRKATPLSIRTDPVAQVSLDGEDVGRTPVTRSLKKDTVRVQVGREGYYPVDTLVPLTQTQRARLDLQLDQRPSPPDPKKFGTLTLNASPSGSVFVDGESHAAGQSIQVRAGTSHHVRFRHSGAEKDTTLTVSEGETKELTCYFTHQVVVLSSPEFASVYLNGENTDEDTTYRTELGPGTYRIGARVDEARDVGSVTGGTYRLRIGEERRDPRKFSGSVKTIEIEPAFARETHVIEFRISETEY